VTIDIAFTRRRLAVFVDGCFWHCCPEHGVVPRANVAYWGPKLARNRERDAETDARMARAGWQPLRLWEHESLDAAVARVIEALDAQTRAVCVSGN
jgi:DNA mismatch endonuclease, patch repair protein